MEKMPIPSAILRLAIPTVFSTIISIIYNLTDTYFIGLLDDPIQLGAISLAFPVFTFLQAVGNMFGLGAPSYISRCLGAKKYDEVRKTSAVSIYVTVIITFVLTLLILIFMEPILSLIGTSSDTVSPTKNYLHIIVGFAVILILQIILPALLRAEGKAKEAMIGMVIGTVVNIVLDPVMILALHMGVAGAAWATVIGNFCAVVFYVVVYLKGNTSLSIQPKDFKPSLQIFKEVIKIGLPSTIAQTLSSIMLILFNNLAVGYGDQVISAYGVAVKMITMEFMIIFGYVQGYVPLAGYNFGAGNVKRMINGLKFTIVTGTGICLLFLIPFTVLAPTYMGAFTTNREIIEIGTLFLHAQAWAVPIMAIQTSLMSTFQATGQAMRALVINLGRQCLFYLPFLYLFNHLWGMNGLLHVQMASDLATTIVAVLIGYPFFKKLLHHKTISEQ
ncbi:MAG: MATE family efflux transporter [Faecalibacillus intestinalis]|uniref:MATE family efflux transporter n=2 Tax=Coprobacillaceae TaxID=2810280 RepID=UPI0039950360